MIWPPVSKVSNVQLRPNIFNHAPKCPFQLRWLQKSLRFCMICFLRHELKIFFFWITELPKIDEPNPYHRTSSSWAIWWIPTHSMETSSNWTKAGRNSWFFNSLKQPLNPKFLWTWSWFFSKTWHSDKSTIWHEIRLKQSASCYQSSLAQQIKTANLGFFSRYVFWRQYKKYRSAFFPCFTDFLFSIWKVNAMNQMIKWRHGIWLCCSATARSYAIGIPASSSLFPLNSELYSLQNLEYQHHRLFNASIGFGFASAMSPLQSRI